jgi:hypothetical protein
MPLGIVRQSTSIWGIRMRYSIYCRRPTMQRLFVRIAILGALIAGMSIALTPKAMAANGVTCTSTTLLISRGVTPLGSETAHIVNCSSAVPVLTVIGAQENIWTESFYSNQQTCYNASSCSTTIGSFSPFPVFEQGQWRFVTAGRAGNSGDPYYYGDIPATTIWLYCNATYCE